MMFFFISLSPLKCCQVKTEEKRKNEEKHYKHETIKMDEDNFCFAVLPHQSQSFFVSFMCIETGANACKE